MYYYTNIYWLRGQWWDLFPEVKGIWYIAQVPKARGQNFCQSSNILEVYQNFRQHSKNPACVTTDGGISVILASCNIYLYSVP